MNFENINFINEDNKSSQKTSSISKSKNISVSSDDHCQFDSGFISSNFSSSTSENFSSFGKSPVKCNQNFPSNFSDPQTMKNDLLDENEKESFWLDINGDSIIHHLIMNTEEEEEIIRYLQENPVPQKLLSFQNFTCYFSPLHLATNLNMPNLVRILVLLGASLASRDKQGNTPLHLACSNGNFKIVKKLTLPPETDEINEIENNFKNFFIQNGIIIKEFFSKDFSSMARKSAQLINYEGKTVLHLAYESGKKSEISFILEHLLTHSRVPINSIENKRGYTLLHEMVRLNDQVGVSLLLTLPLPGSSPQLSINQKCYCKMTPLDMAIYLNHMEISMVLKNEGGMESENHSFKCQNDSGESDLSD